ncbi:uncharacterized protein roh [Linepithema humile]|uniref:uncharacterized protein roh n=1 Tax=Linepithema humile TaxID=83485 RepID=UPI0006235CFF|nr:PREDICTED: uncharacterized protein LOC105667874 [Linepithema humile]XP_012215393.1 PREDICTED: uncharacterized protein LOC105667874 [Linepithema humile]
MSESGSYRPMKYPYTLSAKVAQFPFRYYVNHSWMFKYWLIGIGISLPLFYKIQKLSYSPENVKKWKKTHHDMFTGADHH